LPRLCHGANEIAGDSAKSTRWGRAPWLRVRRTASCAPRLPVGPASLAARKGLDQSRAMPRTRLRLPRRVLTIALLATGCTATAPPPRAVPLDRHFR
jgi:hypothetical protein